MAKDKFIQKSIKHPGALRAAARRDGLTTKQEAEKESHSSNPKIRSRGNLGKRLLGTAKHGNIRHGKHTPKARKGPARKRY